MRLQSTDQSFFNENSPYRPHCIKELASSVIDESNQKPPFIQWNIVFAVAPALYQDDLFLLVHELLEAASQKEKTVNTKEDDGIEHYFLAYDLVYSPENIHRYFENRGQELSQYTYRFYIAEKQKIVIDSKTLERAKGEIKDHGRYILKDIFSAKGSLKNFSLKSLSQQNEVLKIYLKHSQLPWQLKQPLTRYLHKRQHRRHERFGFFCFKRGCKLSTKYSAIFNLLKAANHEYQLRGLEHLHQFLQNDMPAIQQWSTWKMLDVLY